MAVINIPSLIKGLRERLGLTRLTKGEARDFKRRWDAVNAAEKEELASTPITYKFRQIASLLASAGKLGWDKALASVGPECAGSTMPDQANSMPLLAVLRD